MLLFLSCLLPFWNPALHAFIFVWKVLLHLLLFLFYLRGEGEEKMGRSEEGGGGDRESMYGPCSLFCNSVSLHYARVLRGVVRMTCLIKYEGFEDVMCFCVDKIPVLVLYTTVGCVWSVYTSPGSMHAPISLDLGLCSIHNLCQPLPSLTQYMRNWMECNQPQTRKWINFAWWQLFNAFFQELKHQESQMKRCRVNEGAEKGFIKLF